MSKESTPAEAGKKKGIKGRVGIIIILLVVLGFGVFAFLELKKSKEGRQVESNEDAVTVFAVTTTEAVSGQIKNLLNVNGDIIAESEVDVYSDIAGKLIRRRVELGDYVRKDQVVADVDPSRPGMSYAANPVKATISGTITSLPFDIGATVSTQTPIATIGDLGTLQVRTHIPERFISRISMGMTAMLELEAYPGYDFEARVSEISPVVDQVSRTLDIKLDLVDRDPRIKAGMFAKVSLITEVKDDIVRIPTDSIVSRFGEDMVFVLNADGESVEKRIIKEGIRINGVSEVVDGLSAGEKIIYQGQTLLDDKSAVRVARNVQPLD